MKKSCLVLIIFYCASCSLDDVQQNDSEFAIMATRGLERESDNILAWNDSIITHIQSVYPRADTIQIYRNQILSTINDVKVELIDKCGGFNDMTGMIARPYEKEIANEFMITSGRAEAMKTNINQLIVTANGNGIAVWTTIKDAKDIPEFANDPYQADKTYVKFAFENRELSQSLYALEQLKFDILTEERSFLMDKLIQEYTAGNNS